MLNAMTIRWAIAPAVAALLLVAGTAEAQQPAAAATAPATPGWYSYVPGQGWVGYTPASAPPVVSTGTAPAPPAANVAPGWYGYAPASAWAGYAPASAGGAPAVRMQPRNFVYPYGPQRRWAANEAVNGNRPDLVYTLPSYREYGSGRQVPLSKPWLPR